MADISEFKFGCAEIHPEIPASISDETSLLPLGVSRNISAIDKTLAYEYSKT
jgi:hypothetical protein